MDVRSRDGKGVVTRVVFRRARPALVGILLSDRGSSTTIRVTVKIPFLAFFGKITVDVTVREVDGRKNDRLSDQIRGVPPTIVGHSMRVKYKRSRLLRI